MTSPFRIKMSNSWEAPIAGRKTSNAMTIVNSISKRFIGRF
ncbi:MAG TPA: hypothetical protein VLK65_18290 [Vicinamibacteria bacterium]|nr:hypothetical protein [Vicinamibacteria bacterium]